MQQSDRKNGLFCFVTTKRYYMENDAINYHFKYKWSVRNIIMGWKTRKYVLEMVYDLMMQREKTVMKENLEVSSARLTNR